MTTIEHLIQVYDRDRLTPDEFTEVFVELVSAQNVDQVMRLVPPMVMNYLREYVMRSFDPDELIVGPESEARYSRWRAARGFAVPLIRDWLARHNSGEGDRGEL